MADLALADAVAAGKASGDIPANAQVLRDSIQAISVGIVDGQPVLDLDYPEDSSAGADMNVVMTGTGEFVEVQGTAEGAPFDRDLLGQLLDLATAGCARLTEIQAEARAGTPRERVR